MTRMIIDTSSVTWTGLLAGKDEENGIEVEHEGRNVLCNSADFGYEKIVQYIVDIMDGLKLVPNQLIFVVEGKQSKARRVSMYSEYKATRDSHPPQAYEEFNKAVECVTHAFRSVGASICSQAGVEGDDVIAYLCATLEGEKIVMSNDGDLAALLDENVAMVRRGEFVEDNPLGPFPPKFIRVYKALVGDSSDNIKGAQGFGPKSFLDMLVKYGEPGLAGIEGMIKRGELHELEEDVADFKPFRKVIDSAEMVYKSYAVAGLYPEWVNTMRKPLEWFPGIVLPNPSDERLEKWGQRVRLVTADNYAESVELLKRHLKVSSVVTLDIETSTPDESDAWIEALGKEVVDVFGSELTGLGLTFGANNNYTLYFSVEHKDTNNVTSEQVLDALRLIPASSYIVVHNAAFELPILWGEWGKLWADNGWHGFLPNCLDTAILSSYADENRNQGLKKLSQELLGYTQTTYQEVTQGRKMRELTGEEVLSYGADDTICTAALFNHFKMILEIEKTWDVMLQVEQKTSYLKAIAYVQGVKFDLERMRDLEKHDEVEYQKNWAVIRDFLIKSGWHGTVTPEYTELDAKAIKEIVSIVMPGVEFKTQVRTPSKLAILVRELEHESAGLVAELIETDDLAGINALVASRFDGEPRFDENSPKMMGEFLYDLLGLPVRIVNKATDKERAEKRDLAAALGRHNRIWSGSQAEPPLTQAELALVKTKAKSDKIAVEFALLLDRPNDPILKAYQRMKVCETRKTMFYNAYRNLRHWKDNKIHGQSGQCRTVTRRDAPNSPNLAQLPKKGEGVKFRECFLPHHRNAVVVSIDFAQQELRQGAGQSMDVNMLACYVGENLKDMHSMTAAGAMEKKWGKAKVAELVEKIGKSDEYELFTTLRKCDDDSIAKMADDLRKSAKNVNFGAQYDAQAAKLAETLIIPVEDAEAFLQAKFAMFPRFEEWKDEVKLGVRKEGYATTCMGARRHLRASVVSDNKWDVEKAMRQGPNFKIQGSSGEQTKLAQCRIWDSGVLFDLDMHFYFSVHDEIVFSVHKDQVVEAVRVVHSAMTQPYGDLPVPFLGSISVGPNFGNQIELGEEIDEDKIRRTVASLFKSKTVEAVEQ